MHTKKGFTLIEMLVVIAIIAILVSIVVPVVSDHIMQARAATDAANLRIVLGLLNVDVIGGQKTVEQVINNSISPVSKMDPDAILCAVYDEPGFIQVYYVNGNIYYGMDYLTELAAHGSDSPALAIIGTAKPTTPGVWYQAGIGQIDP